MLLSISRIAQQLKAKYGFVTAEPSVTGGLENSASGVVFGPIYYPPNGVDDTVNLQACIDLQWDRGGGDVVIGKGVKCKIKTTVVMRDGVTVYGVDSFGGTGGSASFGSWVDFSDVISGPAFDFKGCFGAHIRNLHFRGSGSADLFAFTQDNTRNVVARSSTIKDCSVWYAKTALTLSAYSYCDFERISVSDAVTDVLIDTSSALFKEFARFTKCAFGATAKCAEIGAGFFTYFDMCDFNDAATLMHLKGGHQIVCNNSYFVRAGDDAILFDSTANDIVDVDFCDSYIAMKGAASSEFAIRSYRQSGTKNITNVVFTGITTVVGSGTPPTNAVSIPFGDISIDKLRNGSGGAVDYADGSSTKIFTTSVKKSGSFFLTGDGAAKNFSYALSSASPYRTAYPSVIASSRRGGSGFDCYVTSSYSGNYTVNLTFETAPPAGAFAVAYQLV